MQAVELSRGFFFFGERRFSVEQIVICGNRVELQEVKIVQSISTESFKQSLNQ
jgi:hypothetical protein